MRSAPIWQARWPRARIVTAPEALAPAVNALISGRVRSPCA
jgi:hypothetical protein